MTPPVHENLLHYLNQGRTRAKAEIFSHKEIFQALAGLLCVDHPDMPDNLITLLVDREGLGSTAIGGGVAIPHVCVDGLSEPVVALLTLSHPILFDAPDERPIDIFVALALPADTAKSYQCQLDALIKNLENLHLLKALRESDADQTLFNHIFMKRVDDDG